MEGQLLDENLMSKNEEQLEDVIEITALHDLVAGGIAGSASVVAGHPFDTIKVRLQTSSGGVRSVIGSVPSLFRGMAAPLSTAAVVNALVFSSFGMSSRLWDDMNGASSTDELELSKSYVCGSFAGLVQCVLICPMEHIKCRLQVTGSSAKGPFHVMSNILDSHGMKGLFRGWWATFWREVPAFGIYFATYDYIKENINNRLREYDPTHSHSWFASAIAGGASGCISWAIVYPTDVIKTKIQTAPLDAPANTLKMSHIARQVIRENGVKYLFRGLGVTLVRAFPVNGIIFPVYEFSLMLFTGTFTQTDR